MGRAGVLKIYPLLRMKNKMQLCPNQEYCEAQRIKIHIMFSERVECQFCYDGNADLAHETSIKC